MGWKNSPPAFCTATETAADLANRNLQNALHKPAQHSLDLAAAKLDSIFQSQANTSSQPQLSSPTKPIPTKANQSTLPVLLPSVILPYHQKPSISSISTCLLTILLRSAKAQTTAAECDQPYYMPSIPFFDQMTFMTMNSGEDQFPSKNYAKVIVPGAQLKLF